MKYTKQVILIVTFATFIFAQSENKSPKEQTIATTQATRHRVCSFLTRVFIILFSDKLKLRSGAVHVSRKMRDEQHLLGTDAMVDVISPKRDSWFS